MSEGYRVSKSALQKVYEKFAMIRLNPEKLGVMVARSPNGDHEVVLALIDGKGVFPLAALLSKKKIDSMRPIITALNEDFQDHLVHEDRVTPQEFGVDGVVLPAFMDGLERYL